MSIRIKVFSRGWFFGVRICRSIDHHDDITASPLRIRVGHSPDADDAFMFYVA
ncbi:MAG: hypothetical protein U0905_01030 [Pirellulales bacterium]